MTHDKPSSYWGIPIDKNPQVATASELNRPHTSSTRPPRQNQPQPVPGPRRWPVRKIVGMCFFMGNPNLKWMIG